MTHLVRVTFQPEKFPTREHYPFSLQVVQRTPCIEFRSPVTFFVGENGSGKSTILEAIAHRCGIHIWRETGRTRLEHNPYEEKLCACLDVDWSDGWVPGSFFSSENFRHFAAMFDEFAATDRGQLKYFGGRSLVTQSHGESFMSFFAARYEIKGLYLLDEPETALSPRRQLELVRILRAMSADGHAQFIVATHSPILLACPGAEIYSFDEAPVTRLRYEQTEHYRLYRQFMADPAPLLEA